MRYSNTSVEQFHLGRLVDGIANGRIGIPEFQRDFDWNENDVRSLLGTVFSGWPAGSLLLLEGDSNLFALRPMEDAPALKRPLFGVLDGQQRLTSLFHALFARGSTRYAVRWDIAPDQDIEEAIISIRSKLWDRRYKSVKQQVEQRLIPLSALKSPTDFFTWRDDALLQVPDAERRSKMKEYITNLYTYRLSAIHDYEFPVVKLDKDTEPSAISRIFEKVNKTGLTLNTFDLSVAKSFDPTWNLRERWITAREESLELSGFLGDDGLPLLQAISLLRKNDLRQSAVLDLSKYDIQEEWEAVAGAAVRVVNFLRAKCGVVRRDFMPYINILPPFIALEARGLMTLNPSFYSNWFWASSFGGSYEAAANTRLVSHYRAAHGQPPKTFEIEDELRIIDFSAATRRSQKALWSAVCCAYIADIELKSGNRISDDVIAELDTGSLFSLDEVALAPRARFSEGPDVEFRSCLNSIFVPKRLASMSRHMDAEDTLTLYNRSDFAGAVGSQTGFDIIQNGATWADFRHIRLQWIIEFMKNEGIKGLSVVTYAPDHGLFNIETL